MTIALSVCSSTTVAAADPKPAFKQVDTNGDAIISAEQAKALKDLDFSKADKDGDDSLNHDEYDHADD